MAARILVVDDDVALSEMIGIVLRGQGFHVDTCADGAFVMGAFIRTKPDLILLDIMLPHKNGIEVCREIRQSHGTPIIMLTAKSEVTDIVAGLEAGADDYVPKPFKPQELVARIKARLRREDMQEISGPVTLDDLVIDPVGHTVTLAGQSVDLTPLEFDILLTLAAHPEQVYTRGKLLEQIWGYSTPGDERLVNVHVGRLRAKIDNDPSREPIIRTVRGIGYRAGRPQ